MSNKLDDKSLEEKNTQSPVTAYPSSSVILLRQSKNSFEVLMERRSQALRFAPGAYVFPGGKVDEEDVFNAANLAMSFDDAEYRIAALRELAEETGVSMPISTVSEMTYFAHWITPPESPKRFETKFYLAHTSEEHTLVKDDIETEEVTWVEPKAMLRGEEEGDVKMMFPTRLNLMKLAQSQTIDEAIARAERDKIVTVMPKHEMRGDEMWFTIPKQAGYPIFEVRRDNIFELMGVEKKV